MEISVYKSISTGSKNSSQLKFDSIGTIAWILPFIVCFADFITELFINRINQFEFILIVGSVMFFSCFLLALLPSKVSKAIGAIFIIIDILIVIF